MDEVQALFQRAMFPAVGLRCPAVGCKFQTHNKADMVRHFDKKSFSHFQVIDADADAEVPVVVDNPTAGADEYNVMLTDFPSPSSLFHWEYSPDVEEGADMFVLTDGFEFEETQPLEEGELEAVAGDQQQQQQQEEQQEQQQQQQQQSLGDLNTSFKNEEGGEFRYYWVEKCREAETVPDFRVSWVFRSPPGFKDDEERFKDDSNEVYVHSPFDVYLGEF